MSRPLFNVSIRIKVAAILLLAIGLLLIGISVITDKVILRSFLRLEQDNQAVNVARIEDAFAEELRGLATSVKDWSHWDDTYAFISDRNADYVTANLSADSIANLNINGMVFIDANSALVSANLIDLEAGTPVAPENVIQYIYSHESLLKHATEGSLVAGLVQLPEGEFLFASRPILTSSGAGPVAGSLVFIKEITPELIADIERRTHLEFSLFSYAAETLPDDVRAAKIQLAAGQTGVTAPLSPVLIAGYSVLEDIDHSPLYMLSVQSDRGIYLNGLQVTQTFKGLFSFFAIFFWLLVSILVEFFFIRYVVKLAADLSRIRKSMNQTDRVQEFYGDEIGDLSRSINALLGDIFKVQGEYQLSNSQLSEQIGVASDSRKAILNLLEDIEAEKATTEVTVATWTRELAEERTRLDASIQSLPLGFIMFDAAGQVLIENAALRSVLGAGKKKITLDNFVKLFTENIDSGNKIKACVLEDRNCTFKDVLLAGKHLDFYLNIVTHRDDNNRHLGSVLLIEDVSEAKIIEKAKTEFVSTASHQLRTPLSTANWYLELLKSADAGPLTADQLAFVTEIAKSTARMGVLVDTLLDASRLEIGGPQLELVPVDIKRLIQAEIDAAKPKIADQKITLQTKFNYAASLKTNGKHLAMVIQNLLSNALKYTPEGGTVTFEVSGRAKSEVIGGQRLKKDSCIITLTDTGYGIPLTQQTKIFEKFFRADNVLNKDEAGTGLGLYIAKSTTEALGGRIWFESIEGQGTTFYLAFPI